MSETPDTSQGSDDIGSQQAFNKFVGPTADTSNSINPNPGEFDDLKETLDANAVEDQKAEQTVTDAAMADLGQYVDNRAAPEGTQGEVAIPETPQELQSDAPAGDRPLVNQ